MKFIKIIKQLSLAEAIHAVEQQQRQHQQHTLTRTHMRQTNIQIKLNRNIRRIK